MAEPTRLSMVCLGNICRLHFELAWSLLERAAEGVVRRLRDHR